MRGKAVAPGFIKMPSWATQSLIADGRSQSDIRQGVTLEVFGEGLSMGPLNEAMKKNLRERQDYVHFDVGWTTLGEYPHYLVARGVSPNIASFVGATTVRIHEIGYEDRGAFAGRTSAHAEARRRGDAPRGSGRRLRPDLCARVDARPEELIALAKVAARHGGSGHLPIYGTRGAVCWKAWTN